VTGSLGRTVVMFGSRLLTRGAQVASFVVLARALSPVDFGHYGVITSAIFLVGIGGHLGLRPAAAWAIGQRVHGAGNIASTLLLAWPVLTALACVTLAVFGLLSVDQTPSARAAIALATSSILLIALAQGVFLGRGQTGCFALSESVPRAGAAVLVCAAWLAGAITLELALLLFAVSFAAVAVPAVVLMFRGTGDRRPVVHAFPSMIRMGLLFAVSLALVMAQGRVGLFFLAAIDAHDLSGQYFAAQRASEMFLEVATALGLVLFSDAARSASPDVAVRSAARAAVRLFLVFCAIGLAAMPFTPLLVDVLLGADYAASAPVLRILLLGIGFAAATRVMNHVVGGLGRPWASGAIALLALTVNVVLCAWLVPRHGASGAAVAMVAGQALATCAYFALVVRGWRVPMRDLMPAPGALRRLAYAISGWLAIAIRREL